jgi:hypothetical protein
VLSFRPSRGFPIAIALAVALAGAPASAGAVPGHGPSRPGRAGWQKIKAAAKLRHAALERGRTANFRAVAANLALSDLSTLRPLAPGHCATAVIYLHNNLLYLENAYTGENFNPLRRAVATEPSISACSPR